MSDDPSFRVPSTSGRQPEGDGTLPLPQQLRLRRVELGLAQGAFFAEVVEFVELVGGGGGRLLADVFVEVGFGVGLGFDRPVAHAVATGDQVDERREERDEDQEDDPDPLRPARHLVVPEEVADDRDEDPDPGDEQEYLEDQQEQVAEVDIR